MPSTIAELHREFRDRGLAVLAVNIQESRSTVAAWVKDNRVTLPVLLDPDATVTSAYGVTATPTAILIGRDGRLIGKAVGPRSWTGPKGRALFDGLLAAGRR